MGTLVWVIGLVAIVLFFLGGTVKAVGFLLWITSEAPFPVAVVYGYGVFPVATVVLVLLSALGIGGS